VGGIVAKEAGAQEHHAGVQDFGKRSVVRGGRVEDAKDGGEVDEEEPGGRAESTELHVGNPGRREQVDPRAFCMETSVLR